jgi:hypothetical protein
MKRLETQPERLITILTKAEQTHLPRKRLSRVSCLPSNPIKIKINIKKPSEKVHKTCDKHSWEPRAQQGRPI